MTDTSIDPTGAQEPHPDKYNDPRAKITRRGTLIGMGVVLFGVVGAAASIYGRRTRLGETTRFWGPETILALQLAERIEMLPRRGSEFEAVELSRMPGLGHLRRMLLDERSFDWQTETEKSVLSQSSENQPEFCLMLRLTDPTAHRFETVEIDIDLASGWVGPSDAEKCIQVVARKRTGLQHFLKTIMDKEQNRYDMRQQQSPGD